MDDLRSLLRDRFDHGDPVTPAEVRAVVRRRSQQRLRVRWAAGAVALAGGLGALVVTVTSAGGDPRSRVVPVTAPSTNAMSPTAPAPATPGADLTISVVPDATTVTAGTPIEVTLVMNNTSGHVLTFPGCGEFVSVGLTSPTVDFDPPMRACLQRFDVPVGVSQSRRTIMTMRASCAADATPDSQLPPCSGPGGRPPALPPGTYRIALAPAHAGVALALTPEITLR